MRHGQNKLHLVSLQDFQSSIVALIKDEAMFKLRHKAVNSKNRAGRGRMTFCDRFEERLWVGSGGGLPSCYQQSASHQSE